MKLNIAKITDPQRWRRYFATRREMQKRDTLDDLLADAWAECGPVQFVQGDAAVLCDAMWFNPNHFLRVRLFIEALAQSGQCFRLLGVLRRQSDTRARRALESIGFRDFVSLEDDPKIRLDDFMGEARHLLHGARSHADFLALRLPHGLPAYVWYDTVLKLAAHPQPPLGDPRWATALAATLRELAFYDRELARREVAHIALSHPWKSEWGTLVWLAVNRGIPAYHLTGFVEAMRVRRFRTPADFRDPVECVPSEAFDALTPEVQSEISRIGGAELGRRSTGKTTDINARHAFRPDLRIGSRNVARADLAADPTRPLCVIYSHVWFDFPHTFAMSNFTDFRDWMETTLAAIREIDTVSWVLKPHPTEGWYGGFYLRDLARDLPQHVRLIATDYDNATVLHAADTVVTVHGTVGLEAASTGLAVILADRSYYSGWGIGHVAESRAAYLDLLARAGTLAPPSEQDRARARAAFALALAEPPEEVGALRMSCDSLGSVLYEEVLARARGSDDLLHREAERLARFLVQWETDSFAAHQLVEAACRRVSARRVAYSA